MSVSRHNLELRDRLNAAHGYNSPPPDPSHYRDIVSSNAIRTTTAGEVWDDKFKKETGIDVPIKLKGGT